MTLVISKGLKLRNQLPADAEADAYIAAVEAADGQALEPGVKFAIKNFVLCCKDDGIWSAIKASCILAGARTLTGALVPLVGTAPTNFNFVSGDYNRKTGLVGDGSTKYLNSNRNNNADPKDSNHNAVYLSSVGTTGLVYMGATDSLSIGSGANTLFSTGSSRSRSATAATTSITLTEGLMGMSRATSTSYGLRLSQQQQTQNVTSQEPFNADVLIYRRQGTVSSYTNARLAFYSIGESLDLALLDARVTDLINAFGAAIP